MPAPFWLGLTASDTVNLIWHHFDRRITSRPLRRRKRMQNPTITVHANDPGNPDPNPAKCSPIDQTITWKLRPNAAAFAAKPIRFQKGWPGKPPVLNLKDDTVTADIDQVLTKKGDKIPYKYTVVLANKMTCDPDIENTGPGGEPDTDDKPRPRRQKA